MTCKAQYLDDGARDFSSSSTAANARPERERCARARALPRTRGRRALPPLARWDIGPATPPTSPPQRGYRAQSIQRCESRETVGIRGGCRLSKRYDPATAWPSPQKPGASRLGNVRGTQAHTSMDRHKSIRPGSYSAKNPPYGWPPPAPDLVEGQRMTPRVFQRRPRTSLQPLALGEFSLSPGIGSEQRLWISRSRQRTSARNPCLP